MFKSTQALQVSMNGILVGKLQKIDGSGIHFSYAKSWLAEGFNLSPFTMDFTEKPQLAKDNLFRGLHGPFADSLPDGWGLLLMDRFFDSHFGDGTARKLTPLDRLAYLGERAMGAFEYHPTVEYGEHSNDINLAELYEASVEIQSGQTNEVLQSLRMAGGSPGGARPKAIVAISREGNQASSAFESLPEGFDHWIVKFRALDEPWETGAIEQAYAIMAGQAGIVMPETRLLEIPVQNDQRNERIFATKRFDRVGNRKRHMITACALAYANFREPSLDYSDLLKLTHMLTKNAVDVEKMARLMVFNALTHNYDDHSKNFAFLYNSDSRTAEEDNWSLAPGYDLTFSEGMGEHTTAYAGRGKPNRKSILDLCKPYPFLKPDEYIEQTLDALANWKNVFNQLNINDKAGKGIFKILEQQWKQF
ncbi:type II toxin-antitoxin system HipA family toxin [Pantoea sp. A4]|uniref:type II toxin-antitoxin system HipA family toxin n=1 Tax=Pantoea sp. A4 TaxID=1225184 RepID=UPI0003626D51|nr:type II toxin-antitoxin system HipA family toxin [Pantoea sp. A4]